MSDQDTMAWTHKAISLIEADYQRSADTHMVALDLPAFSGCGIDLYLKDESTHPTGSLKHRLARSLFLYALCNGWIHKDSTVVEASSGSTAVSEAYFARLLGLPFIAVMAKSTSPEKISQIEFYGGRAHLVDTTSQVYAAAIEQARINNGHYMDQFTYAERATDWRANNNIAQSIFKQMERERNPIPKWIVVGAGTGGTSATIGRYVRYAQHATGLLVADPSGSVFGNFFRSGDASLTGPGSRIEGIGRPRVEASFIRTLVDRMVEVADVESVAAMRELSRLLGRKVGPSTGTNFFAMLELAREMRQKGETGSLVSLLCDSGERYAESYHDAAWVSANFGNCEAQQEKIRALIQA